MGGEVIEKAQSTSLVVAHRNADSVGIFLGASNEAIVRMYPDGKRNPIPVRTLATTNAPMNRAGIPL